MGPELEAALLALAYQVERHGADGDSEVGRALLAASAANGGSFAEPPEQLCAHGVVASSCERLCAVKTHPDIVWVVRRSRWLDEAMHFRVTFELKGRGAGWDTIKVAEILDRLLSDETWWREVVLVALPEEQLFPRRSIFDIAYIASVALHAVLADLRGPEGRRGVDAVAFEVGSAYLASRTVRVESDVCYRIEA